MLSLLVVIFQAYRNTASTSERGRQWHVYFLIYGTGSSSAHAYYVTKWRTTHTGINDELKKWRLGEENGADLCVNEGQ